MDLLSTIKSQLIPGAGRFPQIDSPIVDRNIIGNTVTKAITNPKELSGYLKSQSKIAGNNLLSQTLNTILNGRGNVSESEGALPSSITPDSWLAKAASRTDPWFTYDWSVSLSLGGAILPPQYVERVEFPNWSVDVKSVKRGRHQINYAGELQNTNTCELELYEDNRLTVNRYFTRWRNSMLNLDGTTWMPAEYKGSLIVYPRDAKQQDIGVFVLIGVFPSNFGNFSLGNTTDRHTPLVSLSYDYIRFVHLNLTDLGVPEGQGVSMSPSTLGQLISQPINAALNTVLDSVGQFRDSVISNAVQFGNSAKQKFNSFGNETTTPADLGLSTGDFFNISDSLTS